MSTIDAVEEVNTVAGLDSLITKMATLHSSATPPPIPAKSPLRRLRLTGEWPSPEALNDEIETQVDDESTVSLAYYKALSQRIDQVLHEIEEAMYSHVTLDQPAVEESRHRRSGSYTSSLYSMGSISSTPSDSVDDSLPSSPTSSTTPYLGSRLQAPHSVKYSDVKPLKAPIVEFSDIPEAEHIWSMIGELEPYDRQRFSVTASVQYYTMNQMFPPHPAVHLPNKAAPAPAPQVHVVVPTRKSSLRRKDRISRALRRLS
jgi:hypothetical protein